MKLYSAISNNKGKSEGIGADEQLTIVLNERNHNKFRIEFTGETVEILCYGNGNCITIDYVDGVVIKGEKQKDKWKFHHGGECKNCHRGEITELNSQSICYDCF